MVLNSVGITGASGMLGRHIRGDLHKAGVSIFSTSRTKPKTIFAKEIWNPWDLREWQSEAALNDLFRKVQAIIHAGAVVPHGKEVEDIQTILDVNVRICGCLAEWALKRKIPMVYISGATVYADPEQKNILEDAPKSVGPLGGFYGYSKLLAENVLQFFQRQGLHLIILRPSSIYGDGMAETKMIPKFLQMARNNQIIELTSPVDDQTNFVHASDVSQAVVKALSQKAAGVYNAAYSKPYSILELAENCCDVAGGGTVKVRTNSRSKRPSVRFDLNINQARSAFHFDPQVDLKTGLQKMLQGLA